MIFFFGRGESDISNIGTILHTRRIIRGEGGVKVD